MLVRRVVAACLVVVGLRAAVAPGSEPSASVEVLVARRDLTAGSRMTAADVTRVRWPADQAPADALRQVPHPRRRLTSAVLAGDVVRAARLSPVAVSRSTARLPVGTRGVAVPLGPGLRLVAGDRVDLFATLDGEGAPTRRLAEGCLVVDTVAVDDAVLVAVPSAAAARVASALVQGTVIPVLTGAR